jgi:hypothetical protein
MLRGSIGNHTASVEFVKDLKDDDGKELVGQCVHESLKGHIRVMIDSEARGVGLLDAVCHEAAHGGEYVFAYDVEHHIIYTLTAAITQFLISTGLVLPEEFEARFRHLMLESERKEEK